MIVKNEAHVIQRCLFSVRPIIDRWIIVDTGSTDGTQDLVREQLRDLPGHLFERPWRDFAWNRSEALALSRDQSDFSFIIDADDTLEIAPDFTLPTLTADAYNIEIAFGNLQYWRLQLIRNALHWKYRGVVHEFLTCDDAQTFEILPGLRIRVHEDGARRKDPGTYQRDVAVLEQALLAETDPWLRARYVFYLAQGYRDCGQKEKALKKYLQRAALGCWEEEVFISLYRAAQLMEELKFPADEVIASYLCASGALPTRVEALHGASRFCRVQGRFEEGYQIAKAGLDQPAPPPGSLFVEPWIYDFGLRDEYAINAHWAGHYGDSLDAFLTMLASTKLPASQLQRTAENARFPAAKLKQGRAPEETAKPEAQGVNSHLLHKGEHISRTSAVPRPMPQLFTTHRTVLYIDTASGMLRHGSHTGPSNVRVTLESSNAHIVVVDKGRFRGMMADPRTGSLFVTDRTDLMTRFQPIWLDDGWLGLESGHLFLCAELDGRVTLSREACRDWERFLPADP